MKRLVVITLGSLLMGTAHADERLSLKIGESVTYQCGGIALVKARYYQLSDNSLSFVKLSFQQEKHHYTLPQVVSASGTRYSDNQEFSWWIKGDTAYLEKRNDNGEWKSMYSTPCKQLTFSRP